MSAADRVDGFYKVTFRGGRGIGYRRLAKQREFWTIMRPSFAMFDDGVTITNTDGLPDEAIGERIDLNAP